MGQDLTAHVEGNSQRTRQPELWGSQSSVLTISRPAGLLNGLWRSMRPKQWIKNGFLFAGLIFTLDHRHPLGDLYLVLAGFVLFSLLSSSVYLLNDIADRQQDQLHPKKRYRPIAAGQLDPVLAGWCAVFLSGGSLVGSLALDRGFGLIACLYFLVTLAYSFWLKHVVIVDVLTLASGFVLRAVAGALVISVRISPWLLVCTTLFALFLGLAKRRHELLLLAGDAGRHRKILDEYSITMLDQMITIVTSSTLMAYCLYAFSSPTAMGHRWLMLTIPYVIYGIFRYLYVVQKKGGGGSPATDVLEDAPLLVNLLLWVVTSMAIMVGSRNGWG
jgi:4-hydroxybenzoate polyprenyltransferase